MERMARCSVLLMVALVIPAQAAAAQWFVTVSGTDSAGCGTDPASACRSITQAISLAASGDIVLVGPGRYGDLNRNGVLGDVAGEEVGSPGCGCVLSINKAVTVMSSGGAAVTIIDGTHVERFSNVLLITVGGEFGRPGKGFTVSNTAYYQGDTVRYHAGAGISIDASQVRVRGNQVLILRRLYELIGNDGIVTFNDEPLLIEGNLVQGWGRGIVGRGAATISRNQVIDNGVGVSTTGGTVSGNVLTGNGAAIDVRGSVTIRGNTASLNTTGFRLTGTFTGTLTKNNFYSNYCGTDNYAYGSLVAPNNFWGAPAGPGSAGADRACDRYGITTTTPYATVPFVVKVLRP